MLWHCCDRGTGSLRRKEMQLLFVNQTKALMFLLKDLFSQGVWELGKKRENDGTSSWHCRNSILRSFYMKKKKKKNNAMLA